MKLNELFDGESNIWWNKRDFNMPIAHFEVNGVEYHVIFQYLDQKRDLWVIFYDIDRNPGDEADYQPTGAMGMSGAMVLTSVIGAIQEFIKEYKPRQFVFDGSKSDKLGPLYTVIVKRLSNKITALGYSIESTENDYQNKFKFTKNEDLEESRIDELFNTVGQVSWDNTTPGVRFGDFKIGDQEFQIEFTENYAGKWIIYYGIINDEGDYVFTPTGLAGSGAVKILSVVMNSILEFIKEQQPKLLRFSGNKGNGLGQLYNRMANFLSPKLVQIGYQVMNKDTPSGQYFAITPIQNNTTNETLNTLQPISESKAIASSKAAYNSLSPEAKEAIDQWESSGWIGGKLEQHVRANDGIAQEIAKAFAPVRKAIGSDTIRLYRGFIKYDDHVPPTRHLESWSLSKKVAEYFAGHRTNQVGGNKKEYQKFTDDQVAAAIAKFKRAGFVTFGGKKYAINKQNPEYYNIYSLSNQYITDGDDIESELKSTKLDNDESNLDTQNRSEVLSREIPVKDIIWITNNLNSKEFIVKVDGSGDEDAS